MSFEIKYLKYKQKYLNLIKQTGGNIIVNGSTYLLNTKYDFYYNFDDSNSRYNDLGKMNINSLGFSNDYPDLYFVVISYNGFPIRHTLTIYKITKDFFLPESIYNKILPLTHEQISPFLIRDGKVHSEKYKKLIENVAVEVISSDIRFINIMLKK